MVSAAFYVEREEWFDQIPLKFLLKQNCLFFQVLLSFADHNHSFCFIKNFFLRVHLELLTTPSC